MGYSKHVDLSFFFAKNNANYQQPLKSFYCQKHTSRPKRK